MNLTNEQADRIHIAHQRGAKGGPIAAGRAAFEACALILLRGPQSDELTRHGMWLHTDAIANFLRFRLQEVVPEAADRTIERIQKWFETHGYPEFCLDAAPLEQIQAIVIDEYEKRKKEAR